MKSRSCFQQYLKGLKGLYGAFSRQVNARAVPLLITFGLFLGLSPVAGAQTILALGDSLVAGYGLGKADSFPAKLEAALKDAGFSEARVINAGVSGDTSKGGLSRVDWLFADKPDLLLLELGANDGLRGLPPHKTQENLAAIIEKSLGAGVPVLLAGMVAPPNLGADYGQEFNAVFQQLAQSYDIAFYRFFLEGVAARPELNLSDGMHPNAQGVDVIVERIMPLIEEVISPLRSR